MSLISLCGFEHQRWPVSTALRAVARTHTERHTRVHTHPVPHVTTHAAGTLSAHRHTHSYTRTHPVPDVVTHAAGSAQCRAETPCPDDRSAPLLHCGDEWTVEVWVIVDCGTDGGTTHCAVIHIGVPVCVHTHTDEHTNTAQQSAAQPCTVRRPFSSQALALSLLQRDSKLTHMPQVQVSLASKG